MPSPESITDSHQKRIVVLGASAESLIGFRKELLKQLAEKGLSVFALAPEIPQNISDQLSAMGVTPVQVPLDRGGVSVWNDLRSLFALRKTLREISPDIILSYFAKPIIFGTLAAFLARVPRRYALLEGLGFFFIERPEPDSLKVKLTRMIMVCLYWLSLPLVHKLFILNSDDHKDLIVRYKIPVKKIELLGPIGLDLKKFEAPSPPPTSPVTFLFMGRLLREKGIFEFLEAAEQVKSQHKDARFVVLGEADPQNPGSVSEQYLNSYIKRGILQYPGQVENVAEWFSECSVFVLPSYREGFPRSTQEAMSMGRPIITTDVPGCRETIREGENGFLVPPFDAKTLAEKMSAFLDNPELISQMGRQSRERAVRDFDEVKNSSRLANWLLAQD